MSELEIIQSTLMRVRRRCRWQRAWLGAWRGLLLGAIAWGSVLLTYKLFPIPSSTLLVAAGLGIATVLVGFFYGWARQMTIEEVARRVDDRQQLKERLSTALEMASLPTNETWRCLLVADAANFASKVDPKQLFPFRLPQFSRWALLILALSAGLGFVPEYRTKAYREQQLDAATVKAVGQKMVEVTRQNLEQRRPALEPTRKALESVEQTGLQLAQASLTRNEALKDLANVTDKLKSELKQLRDPAVKSLERAARESAHSPGGTSAEIQKKIDELQKSLGKATDPAALNQLKSDLQKAQKAAAGMPQGDSPAAAAARQQMAQNLSDLSRKATEMGKEIPSLEEAIAALQAGKTENFVKDLDSATIDMEKLQEMSRTLQQLQQQTKEGKDLPEQLAMGQAETAQKTLQKMMDQLKSGTMSPEELKKMLNEVARSVDPASPYGKAAAALKKSANQLKSSQKAEAAQSLAEASKELQKALDQMQDAQSVMASLEALNKAEMAIATHRGWGQGPPGRRPGSGPGSRPGAGVGTWAEDGGMLYYPEMTESWDNSGLSRPDMDPRGLTDRGDSQLADNLAPTKLHGQVTPGGPMPSITLKGMSIKGRSSVEYQETVTAAQSAAQSALNQDQVPRAYQGAVRDYFDDLKK